MTSLRLTLMRHAKAETASGASDHARRLSPRGQAEAGAAGRRLAALVRPDLALCSDSARTRETYDRLAPAWTPGPPHRFTRALYGATGGAILAEIRATPPDVRCLLVIGHNPGIGDIARRLAGRGDAAALADLAEGFPTSCFAIIGFDAAGWANLGAAGHLDYLFPADERSGS